MYYNCINHMYIEGSFFMTNKRLLSARLKRFVSVVVLTAVMFSCDGYINGKTDYVYAQESKIESDVPDLKDSMTEKMGDDFIVGASICLSDLSDENTMALVKKHFNAITFGNELKPDSNFNYSNDRCPGTEEVKLNGETIVVPVINFDRPEKMLEEIYKWNQENPDDFIKIRGHVLTWHSQTPEWFFHEDYDAQKPYVSPDEMTRRHEWYIKTVLEHFVGKDSKYKDMFYGWDVVNEAVSDSSGTYRTDKENSSWWAVYGSNEFIINAFRFANKYAPASLELYYNDYGECDTKKVKGIEQLLKDVKSAEGTRIDAMGMQGHYLTAEFPSIDDFKSAARTYADIVGKVQLTELDFQASAEYDGTSATYNKENSKLANRYKDFYDAMKELKAEGINVSGMTLWGVIDRNSWLQHASFVGGGTNGSKKQTPLIFDDDYKVKPAYWAFVDEEKMASVIDSYNLEFEEEEKEEKKVKPEASLSIPYGIAVVDGEMEEIWNITEEVPLNINLGAKATATAKMIWDEESLYVFFKVKDSVLNTDNANEYEKDSVEIFIDERNHKSETYKDDDKQYRINCLNEQSFNGEECTADNIISAVKKTSDGYQVEAAIKWTHLHPLYGKEIGLELQVNDADKSGKRIGTLSWYDKSGTGYMNPSVFGTVKLVHEATNVNTEQSDEIQPATQNTPEESGNIFVRFWNWLKELFAAIFSIFTK